MRGGFPFQENYCRFLGKAKLHAFVPLSGRSLLARVAFGSPDQETLATPDTALERRYALRAVVDRG